MRPDELERRLRANLDALGPAPRAEQLHVLMLPYLERAERIGVAQARSRTQSEVRVTFRTRSSFVAACPAATTDPIARLASPRVAKRACSSHPCPSGWRRWTE
jgi:hypothetical protein